MNVRMKTGLLISLVIAAVALVSIWLPWVMLLATGLIFLYSATELYEALRRRLRPLPLTPVLLGTALGFSPVYVWIVFRRLSGWHAMPLRTANLDQSLVNNNAWLTSMCWLLALGLAVYAFLFFLFSMLNIVIQLLIKGPAFLPNAVATSFAALFLSFPLASSVLFMYAIPNGWRWIVAVILTAAATDVSAYYAGRFFGQRKILPSLSKNKSLEGTLSALLFSGIVMAFYFAFVMRGGLPQHKGFAMNFLFGIGYGILLSFSCQLGDWICSGIKRWCELKDFSKTFPGHGGMLDRFDSYTFGLPFGLFAAYLYYMIEH